MHPRGYNRRMADASCPQCHGSGWVITEKRGMTAASRCTCDQTGRAQVLEDRANIPPLYANASFDNFVLPNDNPTANRGLASVMLTVKSFAREFPATEKPGLLLVGEPGCGKTHLAIAAMRILLSRGFEATFFDYQNLLDCIRSGYDPASNSSNREAFQTAMDAEILLLDDLGAHRVTDWVEDTVTSIITYRCNNRKPLIATTNLPDPDAGGMVLPNGAPNLTGKMDYRISLGERIGQRARSRLFEMCRVVRMPQIDDYRIRKSGGR